MTTAIQKRHNRGSSADPSTDATSHDSSKGKVSETSGVEVLCNDDSTVCNSPWSSERGGGGGSFSGAPLRSSSAHGEGDVAGGYGASRLITSGMSSTASEASGARSNRRRRGRTPGSRDSPGKQRGWWQWRSYSPPGPVDRHKNELARRASVDKKGQGSTGETPKGAATPPRSASIGGRLNNGGLATITTGAVTSFISGGAFPLAQLEYPTEGAGVEARPSDAIVRAGGGYLPPRHPLAALMLSPVSTPGRRSGATSGSRSPRHAAAGSGGDGEGGEAAPPASPSAAVSALEEEDEDCAEAAVGVGAAAGVDSTSLSTDETFRGAVARGAARPAKGPAADDMEEGDAPTEERGTTGARRRRTTAGETNGEGRGLAMATAAFVEYPNRPKSISGFMSEFADWLMPGMDRKKRQVTKDEKILVIDVYADRTHSREFKSAPATPRGRMSKSAVLRGGGWFYNGDSDYSSSEEDIYESDDDEGFWADAGTIEPVRPTPRNLGGGGGVGILERLRSLFT